MFILHQEMAELVKSGGDYYLHVFINSKSMFRIVCVFHVNIVWLLVHYEGEAQTIPPVVR